MKTQSMKNALILTTRTALPALLLCGCVTTTSFTPPAAPTLTQYDTQTPPAELGSGDTGSVQRFVAATAGAANWWQGFESPAIDAIVQQALSANRTLAESAARVEQAQELFNAATGARLPRVELTGSGARQKFGEQLLGDQFKIPPFTAYGIGPSVSYTLDYTGGTARSIEQRQALTDYQQQQHAAARLAISGHAVLHSLAIASIQEQIATVEELLERDRETVRLVRTAREAGSASGLDVSSAESQLASDLTLLPPLRNQLGMEQRALAVVMGNAPAQAQIPPLELAQIALPATLPLTVPSELVRGRPDILSAESQLHAATAALGVAEANLYPRITLTAATSQQAVELGNIFNASKNAWALMAGLTAPLFDGGTLRAEKRAAAAALKASAASYEQTVLSAFAQVGDALQALQEDAEQMRAQSAAQASARETAELTRRAYEEGEIGVLQVLDAERRYQQARLGYVRALAARYRDTAQFFLAVGPAI
jgi:NodT family efflux transporter outer membrane factor (OMF) lipoprotein